MKSTHSDSESAEPIAKGKTGNTKNRPLDKEQGDANADTSAAAPVTVFPSGKIAEDEIKALFGTVEGLSEDFGTKAAVIFEGAVSARIEEIKEALETEYSTKLTEATEQAQLDLVEHLDTYLDMFIEEYMDTNAIAIEEGIRNEFSENVMESVASIVESYGIKLPEDKIDVANELAETVAELEKSLNESINNQAELARQLRSFELAESFGKLTEGMDQLSREKLKKLTENIVYDNVTQYAEKVSILKESVLVSASADSKPALNEEVTLTEAKKADGLEDWQRHMLEVARGTRG